MQNDLDTYQKMVKNLEKSNKIRSEIITIQDSLITDLEKRYKESKIKELKVFKAGIALGVGIMGSLVIIFQIIKYLN